MPEPDPESADAITGAAARFLASLGPAEIVRAAVDFGDDARRRDWHYIPRRRAGLPFVAMTAVQQKAAYDLLASGLGPAAFAAAATIIGLEDVLDGLEGGTGPPRGATKPDDWGRHRADYSTTVFGRPGDVDGWGWRFEGHHVSVNLTVVDGQLQATPLFLGSNPAEVLARSGHPVVRPLAAEEDLALELIELLDPAQREAAVISDIAPDDILTAAAPSLDELPELVGVRLAELAGSAGSRAEALVHHYLDRLPGPLSERRWAQLRPHLGDVRFAFGGEPVHRRPQYYRLVGPSLFVEYDNTQDDANHVHTVLRDPAGDFGDDLLREHRRRHHPA